MTPSGIKPATFRFVAQYLNHCATAVPCLTYIVLVFYARVVLNRTREGKTILKWTFSTHDNATDMSLNIRVTPGSYEITVVVNM